ncbi:hypothetical protein EHW99_0016 [Erwinia amylovora]|uniref:Uncharacterized protein n=2 Tax=Erwinia amylovora TaxID=552 RepID=A0A830ZXA5_ERWAM|nr:hypothetical protein EaACW_0018 [Erwinia amylovora ACW56400]QJQ52723.1 hypothetical protein EHX00_0016 [Erwinia amylovora]CBA18958.1 hypothetical protein predicted by Glimmer/Critica [Erwinia amylovora CFBP1430]CCO76866.1 hypothetical protein BN432_0018 [Erwinia amylovora Ea356]CCO80642.1 hypothetical protein BN433_0020 [Erwinia amylovora Ea266]CCO84457.1 hypothetical protein BN434_0018 [Erwinia amylovora CFBP 2585]CCO88240.1 hypothetical protein BN435_0017 [Erwinia amylovora 01SFR-BO]CCO
MLARRWLFFQTQKALLPSPQRVGESDFYTFCYIEMI